MTKLVSLISNYFQLTKPPIMLLVVFSGATSLFLEGTFLKEKDFFSFILILIGLFLTGGSANAFNQYFERKVDAKMTRTRKRRPLPQGNISVRGAFVFSLFIGLLGVVLFGVFFNLISALLSLGTILFYSLFYTLYLKPNTSQNIVIGGVAGAMPPLIAFAAITGSLFHPMPWILFLIIFFWTPPHFWSLALFYKEDYKEVNYPMHPVVKGDNATLRLIFIYTLILVGITGSMLVVNAKWLYLAVAIVLGIIFIKKSYWTMKHKTKKLERNLFGYSIIYLFVLFFSMIFDRIIF